MDIIFKTPFLSGKKSRSRLCRHHLGERAGWARAAADLRRHFQPGRSQVRRAVRALLHRPRHVRADGDRVRRRRHQGPLRR